MDKKHIVFLFTAAILFVMGLLTVFNTTSAEILDKAVDRNIHHAVIKQILYAIVGVIFAVMARFAGGALILRLSGPLLIFFSLLLVAVFIPGIGMQVNGAKRWISLMGNSFQPSEFVKYLIPLYCIHCLTSNPRAPNFRFFSMLALRICIPLGLILIEPDNGTVFIIGVTSVVLCLLTKIRWTYWLLPLILIGGIGVSIGFRSQHAYDRIAVFLHPENDLLGKGHQPHQAKIAAGSGCFWGRGFGESLQKMNYLPEARSDYIAAIFAEEFGFFGIGMMIFAYMMMGLSGYWIAMSCKDRGGFYAISILVFLLCFQAFFNLAVVSGLLPSKGMNLPFFSQGGSSLTAQFLSVGIILAFARESSEVYESTIG